ncbi:MAG: M36 family metallopeptidase, partial [Verrucomicrobia bacterium]|nr:M36 family metallopeptidase [Verrucomicrobiota bacterium]
MFTSDSPSPLSPGYPTPVTNQPPLVERTLVTLSALDTNASPAGWINDGGNETLGNNVDAHTDLNADDMPDLPRPQGSTFRVFDFPMDLTTQDPTSYSQAAVVQLFYLCNWYHDKLYELGFTEAAGNFQSNNFGRGGLANDAVQADAQDGSGTDNANFSTPPDGSPGRMQMHIFTSMSPRRDGDLDAEIVLHEYSHGLSWRLVGGGQGLGTVQSDGLGEGWSDFYGLSLLSQPGDDVNGNYAAGAYASYKIGGASDLQNYYFGIRRYPYTTDMARNPLTFKDIDPAQADYCSSAAPYHTAMFGTCSAANASEVHNEGEVWCVTLWDARANLINKYGWAVGNQLILQLVTDGMKLTPMRPNFLQARDAIILADLVDTGGANRNELWAAFAKRGMGFSATSPASTTASGVHESFDLPDDLRITPSDGFVGRGRVGGPFTPNSVTFTLTNAGSSSLSWILVNPSTWLNVSPSGGTLTPGGPAASVTANLNASATSLPMGVDPATVWFTNLNSRAWFARNFTLRVGQPDFYTELFDTTTNDLAFQTFTFTPDGSASYYRVCREVAASFPTDPTGGITVSLGDDSYAQVTLSGTNTVAIYSRRTNVFFIGSNGYLTMDSGDHTPSESFANHFNRPRVSACFDDLYPPGAGGAISWKQLNDRAVITFSNVQEYGSSATVSFQVEMFYDGRIRLTYLGGGIGDGLAGLSAGDGVPAGFTESDLTTYGACAPPNDLVVTLSADLASHGYQGGPFTPSGTTYALSNVGTNSLTWSATATQPWLSVSPTNGLLAASADTNITIDINSQANLLAPGAYTATVTYSNLSGGLPQTSSVTLTVLAIPGEIEVLDSIPPINDLQMPFGDSIIGVARTEHITLTNSDPTYGLLISNISFGVYYNENFNDGLAQDWVETTDAYWSVVGGEYRAQAGVTSVMMQSIYTGLRWQNSAAQVVARRRGDDIAMAGVAMRASDDFIWRNDVQTGSAYCVGIRGNGYYWVAKFVSGQFTFLQSLTTSALLNQGATPNTVLFSVNGSALRVYFNGSLAWTGADTSIPGPGRVGLLAFSGGSSEAIHYFDNVTVAEPVTDIAAVDSQQQSYNSQPLAGGSAKETPPNAPPVPAREQHALDGGVHIQSLISGPFRLENLPTLPYTIPPRAALTFDVICQPTAPSSNYNKVIIEVNDADEPRVEVQLTARGILDYLQVMPAADFASRGHPRGPFTPSSASY